MNKKDQQALDELQAYLDSRTERTNKLSDIKIIANTIANRKSAQDPIARANRAESNRKKAQDPIWQQAFLEGRKKVDQKSVGKKMASDPEWQRKHNEQVSKLKDNPVFMEKTAKNNKAKRNDVDHIKRHQEGIDKRTASEDWIRKNCRPVKCPYGIFPVVKHAMLEYQKEHGGVITSIAVKIRGWLKSDNKPEWQYLTWEEYDEQTR